MTPNLLSSTDEASKILYDTALGLDRKKQGLPYDIPYKEFNKFLRTMEKTAETLKGGFHKNQDIDWAIENGFCQSVVAIFNLKSPERVNAQDISAGLELLSEEFERYTMLKDSEVSQVISHMGMIHHWMLREKDYDYRLRFAA